MDIGHKVISYEDHEMVCKYYESMFMLDDNKRNERYDETASTYDHINNVIEYIGYNFVGKKLWECFGETDVSSKLVLDVGCGTGLLGRAMVTHGFKQIHALDPSQAILDEAKKKNIYSKYICRPMTMDPLPGVANDTYDATASSGCLVPGHIMVEALEEFARITKKGGFIVVTIRDPDFEMGFMEILGKLMREKKFELLSMESVPYKREYSENYKQVYGYLVSMKVL